MKFIYARCKDAQAVSDGDIAVSAGNVRKYTYVLPSGRKIKVVVDDESEFVETAATTPCFLVRMEDELES